MLLDNLTKRIQKAKDKWVEELPDVLWTYRMTKRVPNGKTPFSLVYGAEAIILVEVYMPTLRTRDPNYDQNSQQLQIFQDLSKEQRELVVIRIAAYQ